MTVDFSIIFEQLITIESRINALIELKYKDDKEQLREFNKAAQAHREVILKDLSNRYPDIVKIN